MLRALPSYAARVPDVEVGGHGRWQPAQELESRSTRDSASPITCEFTGRVSDDERDRQLAEAHVFAMPSRLPPSGTEGGEGFGIVYLEAGLQGLPVVAGAVGGALDAVVHDETGLLVDPTSSEDLAAALSTAAPGRRSSAGRSGKPATNARAASRGSG